MEKSKIEWCDYSYNPVTGCLHNCPYCYAEKMSRRFCGDIRHNKTVADFSENNGIYEIENEIVSRNGRSVTYPFGFAPTLHRNRLTKNCKPAKVKKPSTFFVCSTADLFGEWVPAEWVDNVLEVCEHNPRHRYLFLTKNPSGYISLFPIWKALHNKELYKNFWLGTSISSKDDIYKVFLMQDIHMRYKINTFLSIEPIFENIATPEFRNTGIQWVIVGAETGQRRNKVVPEKQWIEDIVSVCKRNGIPVFLKNNLANVWKDELIQQYPWSV